MTHIDSAAQRKIGIEGWEPCVFEAITGGMLITGGIPKMANGKKKWPARKLMDRIILTETDVSTEEDRYESETGNCRVCYGTGQQTIGWSAADGIRTRSCPTCGGVGRVS